MNTKIILLFERCVNGVRVIVWQDYYNDGEVELTDIMEVTGERPIIQSRNVVDNLSRFMFGTEVIIECDGVIVFDKFDIDEDRKKLEKWVREKFKETLAIPLQESRLA